MKPSREIAKQNSNLDIEIDNSSGFCFGVINAIKQAEKQLEKGEKLYCLGDIVHNNLEVSRLEEKGLVTIDYDKYKTLSGNKVLLRAHGEPPAVYEFAKKHDIKLVDATCPVVLALQRKIKRKYQTTRDIDAQIVIYGKHGHAEVNGLVGQTDGNAIVIQSMEEVDKIDFSKPIILFSQTTMPIDGFEALIEYIQEHIDDGLLFEHTDTICRQVANRMPNIGEFASKKDWVYFVAGRKSSNGKVLYGHCKEANPNSIFISSPDEIVDPLPSWVESVGICGATSTPKWLMEKVAQKVKEVGKEN